MRGTINREELGVEPLLLHVERSQMRRLRHLIGISPSLSDEVFREHPFGPWKVSGHSEGTVSLGWPRNTLGSFPEEVDKVAGEREV